MQRRHPGIDESSPRHAPHLPLTVAEGSRQGRDPEAEHPAQQLGGDVLAQDIIEALDSLAVTGTRGSAAWVGDMITIR
jgi:hypothetical protein